MGVFSWELSFPLLYMRREIDLVVGDAEGYAVGGRFTVLAFVAAVGDVEYFVFIDNEMFCFGFEIGVPAVIFVERGADFFGDGCGLVRRYAHRVHCPLFDPWRAMLLGDRFDGS